MNDRSETPAKEAPERLDPRVVLAAERTLLAWIRTGLALMGFGFVVAKFGLILQELAGTSPPDPWRQTASLVMGASLVLAGVLATAWAAWRHTRDLRRLERGEPLPEARRVMVVTSTAMIAAFGLLLALYVVLVS